MPQKQIKFGIGFNTDLSGLKQIEAELTRIAQLPTNKLIDEKEIVKVEQAKVAAKELKALFNSSYNFKLNTLDISKFSQELNKSGKSLHDYQLILRRIGDQGKTAFRHLTAEIAASNTELKQSKSILDSMGQTFINTVKWSIASSAINNFTGSIQKAYSFSKQLDESLNDIRIVTGKSADEMDRFAVRANKAAAALGKTTKDYTTASLLFYQQGLSDRDVQARTNVTLKAANVTGQSTSEVSEQLTAIWNGYKVSAQEAETYIDKVAAVAASTASNLEELSQGMSKVAAAANNMGVDIDQLNAQLSTIISVTRQDAGVAGTALKTIYARMTDIESGLDTETTLGRYTAEMAKFGIQVLDAKGGLRDVGDVMDEIGGKWTSFTREQQVALAQAMAGTRQYNNLMALFGNWDMYTKSLETSREAMGTLQNQQDIYMESLEGHLNQLTAAQEHLYDSLFDSESFKALLDVVTNVVNGIGNITDALGGAVPTISLLAGLLLQIFSRPIGNEIAKIAINIQNSNTNIETAKQKLELLKNATFSAEKGLNEFNKAIVDVGIELAELQKKRLITPEEQQALQEHIRKLNDLADEYEVIKQKREAGAAYLAGSNATDAQRKQKVEELRDYESELNNTKLNWVGAVKETVKNTSDDADILIDKLKELAVLNKDFADSDIGKSVVELDKVRNSFNQLTFSGKNVIDSLKKSTEQFNKDLEQSDANVHKYTENISQYDEDAAIEIQAAWDNVKNKIQKVAEDSQLTQSQKISEAKKLYEDFFAEINKGYERTGAAAEAMANAVKQQGQKTIEEANNTKQSINLDDAEMRKRAQGITTLAGALTTAGAAIGSVINIFKTLGDTSKSSGERVKGAITGIIALAPAVISVIMSIKTAMDAFNLSLGPLLLIVLAIGAAIAAIAVTAVVTSNLINRNANALKKAKENAKEAADAFDQVKQSYDNLKASLEDYQDAQNAIDELVKGTDEWRKAINEANLKVLELISSYSELAKYVSTDENGRMTISQEGMDALVASRYEAVQNASVNKLVAQSVLTRQQEQYDAGQLRERLGYGNARIGWATAGAAIGAYSTSMLLGGFGMGPGAVMAGAAANAAARDHYANIVQDAITQLAEAGDVELLLNTKSSQELADMLGIEKELAESLIANRKAVVENTAKIQANNEISKAANTQIMQTYMQQHGGSAFADSEVQNTIASLMGNAYKEEFEKALKEFADGGSAKMTDEEAQREYARQMGYTWVKNNSGNKGTYSRINENGEIEEFTLSDEIARQAVASAMAQERASQAVNMASINRIASLVGRDLGNSTVAIRSRQALMGLAGGKTITSFENLSQKEATELQNKILNGNITEQEAKDFGFDSLEKFITAVNNSVQALKDSWEDAAKSIYDENVRAEFDEAFNYLEDLSLQNRQKLAKLYTEMGEEGASVVTEFLSSMGDSSKAVAEIINAIDWNKTDALDQFSKALRDLGINTNEAHDDIVNVYEAIRKTQDSYGRFDVEQAEKIIATVNKIVTSVKEIGDTISAEDYNDLSEAAQNYFIKMADGTYALTKSAAEFYAVAYREQRQMAARATNDALDALKTAQEKSIFEGQASLDAQNAYEQSHRLRGATTTATQAIVNNYVHGNANKDTKALSVDQRMQLAAAVDEMVAAGFIDTNQANKYKSDLTDNSSMWREWYNDLLDSSKEYYQLVMSQTNDVSLDEYLRQAKDQYEKENTFDQKAYQQSILDAFKYQLSLAGTAEESQSIYEQLLADETFKATLGSNEEFKELLNKTLQDYKVFQQDWQANNKINIVSDQEKYATALERTEAILSRLAEKDHKYGIEKINNLKEQSKLYDDIINEQIALVDYLRTGKTNEVNQNYIGAFGQLVSFTSAMTANNDAISLKNLLAGTGFEGLSENALQEALLNLSDEELYALLAQLEINANKIGLDKQTREQLTSILKDFKTAADEKINLEIEILNEESKLEKDKQERLNHELEIIESELALITNTTELIKSYDDFVRKLNTDNYTAIASSYLFDANATTLNLQGLYKTRNDLLQQNISEEEVFEKLIENAKQIQQETLALQESLTQAEETRLTLAEKITEQYESQSKYYDMMRQTLQHQINMAKLLYGDSNYSEQVKYYSDLYDKTSKMLEISARQVATTQAAYEALKESDSDIAKKAYEDYIQAQKQYLDSIEDTLEAAQEKFENVILGAFELFANNLAGGRFADALSQYNWQQEFDQENMTGMRRELNISNIGIAYQRAINGYAGDISAQARLTAIYREQVALLKDKDYLNKNDITLAEKRLELEKARIDLENARADTSTLRLVRGAGGEYSYQYVANEDNILSKIEALNRAELDYADSMNAAVKNGLDMYQTIMDLWHEFAQASTDEERNQVLGRIKDVFAAMSDAFKGLDLSNAPQELINFITALRNGDTDEGLDSLMETAQKLAGEFSTIQKTLGDKSDESSATLMSSLNDGVLMTEDMANALEDQVSALDELILRSSDYANNLAMAKENALIASEALIASAAALNGIDLDGFSVSANPMRSLSGIVYSMSNIGALSTATMGANAVENTTTSNNTEVNGQQIVQYISAQFPGVTTVAQIIEALEKIGTESIQENG